MHLNALKALGVQPRRRRLRHGLLVAELPAAVPDRHAQDRPLVRASASTAARRSRRSPAAIVRLAQSLRLVAVAEGVETEDQADMLRQPRLPARPGLPLRPPAPAADISALLAAEAEPRSSATL